MKIAMTTSVVTVMCALAMPASTDIALTSGYHTFKIEVAPNGATANVYLDGSTTASATPALNLAFHMGLSTNLIFGDTTTGSPAVKGAGDWDYINVNPIPEPSTTAL